VIKYLIYLMVALSILSIP